MFASRFSARLAVVLGTLVAARSAAAEPAADPKEHRSVRPGALTLGKSTLALTPELATKVRQPTSVAISPDGKWVVIALKETHLDENSATTQLFIVSSSGGALRQLTFNEASSQEPAWSPDSQRIAFSSTRDDVSQIYVLDLAGGGEARRRTELSTGASGPLWSPDGRTIAFVSEVHPECREDACNRQKAEEHGKKKTKARAYDELFFRHWSAWDDGTRSHLFVVPADGHEPPRDLTPGAVRVPSLALTDGLGYAFAGNDALVYAANADKELALSTNVDLFSVPVAGGAPRALTTNKGRDAEPVASPDGRYVAYVSSARPGYESDRSVLFVYDTKSGRAVARTDSFDRSVDEVVWMPSGRGLYFTAADRAHRDLFSVGLEAGEPARVLESRYVTDLSAASDGTLAFVESKADRPPEVFVYSPATREARMITHLNDGLAETLRLGKTEELEVEVGGGTKVHGLVTYPPGFRAGNRYPLVVLIHGGPEGAAFDRWHPRWNMQLFASRGYVVAAPNFRGSLGYGQRFTDAVTKDWGGGPYDDVMAFTEALAKKPFIDERWMCAAGGSYGGYLVNWIAGHTTRFKCLITHAGIFDLESMWGDTEELWFPEWELGGPPWASREAYRRFSPHLFIDRAKTPTLVIHGQLDYRVNLSHGLQMFTSLRRLGVPARFVYFPDEGHFVSKPENWVYWYGEMLGWLGKYLR